MLLPAEILPFLLHAEQDVREHAIRYLGGAADPAPATAGDVWTAIDRYAGVSKLRFLAYLGHFPHDGAAAERLVSELQRTADAQERTYLLKALVALPAGTARDIVDAPTLLARCPAEAVTALRARVELAGRSAGDLLGDVHQVAAALARSTTTNNLLLTAGAGAVRTLGEHHREQAMAWGHATLREPACDEDTEQGWLQTLALSLFGDIPFEGPPGALLQWLGEEMSGHADMFATDALVRLGSAELIQVLEASFPGGDWFLRGSVSKVLGRIKRPESEEALIRLFRAAPDDIATHVATDLCALCTTSPEALDRIAEMVNAEDYDPQVVALDEWALTIGKMVGRAFPDEGLWRARIEDRRAFYAERSAAALKRRAPPGPNREARRGAGISAAKAPLKFVGYGKSSKKKRK